MFALIAVAVLAALPAACQLGYAIGRAASRPDDHELENIVHWQNGVLAIAGLLIGFSFSMATTRYDARKQVLVAEASAIENAHQRTYLVDKQAGEELRELLRRYVAGRVALFEMGVDRARIEREEQADAELAEQMWRRAAAVARADPHAVTTGLLLQSLNRMRDLAADRRDARENPVPWTVFLVLILSSTVAMASVGYACGLTGKRLPFGMVVIPLLVAGVIVLVYDLASPQVGIMRPGDQMFLRLQQRL